jgi:hypothetical protein
MSLKTQDIMTYSVPNLDVNFDSTLMLVDLMLVLSDAVPVLKPFVTAGLPVSIPIELISNIKVDANLVAGLDTYGINEWYKAGMGMNSDDILTLLDGFYLSDNLVNGIDLPELDATIDVALRAALKIGNKPFGLYADAYAQAGVETSWMLDLIDGGELAGTNDGKVRVSELSNGIWVDTMGDLKLLAGATLDLDPKTGVKNLAKLITEQAWLQDTITYVTKDMKQLYLATDTSYTKNLWEESTVLQV